MAFSKSRNVKIMPAHQEHVISKYSITQIFNMVAEIEKYPEFIPWCSKAKILEMRENFIVAELFISFKGFTHSYVSEVTIVPPVESAAIKVKAIKGPFKYLTNDWHFRKTPNNGCEINFNIDFTFDNFILEKLFGLLFYKAIKKMMQSFKQRADELYGQ
jgi:coenzyme Q-binding protein COQ10